MDLKCTFMSAYSLVDLKCIIEVNTIQHTINILNMPNQA